MNNFIYENKTKVYFGKGGVKEYLGCLLKNYNTVMLAYGGGSIKKNGIYNEIIGILNSAEKNIVEFSGIMPNPTYKKVLEGAKIARENNVEFILAVGGGSVIDCCKIVSAQAKIDEDIWENITKKKKFPTEFIPMGAVVTASGTGSEMNAGAVITNETEKIKCGLFGAQADFAFLDPMYTMSVPFEQVISGAFDTLSHAMETYFGKPTENNLSDDINEAVMRSVQKYARAAHRARELRRSERVDVGKLNGGERNPQNRQDHGLSGAPDRTSARRVNRLQSRKRSCCNSPCFVPSHLQGRFGKVREICKKCLGNFKQKFR